MKQLLDGEVKKGAAFVTAAFKLGLKPGEAGTFDCPICGHTVVAKASVNNGHIHTSCSGCGVTMIQ